VIDTGIDPNHPDLKDAISKTTLGYDFVNNDNDPMDDHLHGTHVAGTIAAAINSGGVYGINPTVELVALKICTAQGYCPSYAITNAIKYAADKGIEVLNMSL
jgi:subtilisin family serine protease